MKCIQKNPQKNCIDKKRINNRGIKEKERCKAVGIGKAKWKGFIS